MPRPHKPTANEVELERKIHTLQVTLLQANSALKLKIDYCERLEFLLRQRNERVDQLFSQLHLAWQRNRKLDEENEHLAGIIANDNRPQAHIERTPEVH